jgi:hypothetical protein
LDSRFGLRVSSSLESGIHLIRGETNCRQEAYEIGYYPDFFRQAIEVILQ